ncbi:MAG: helix-turn-helix domain-containing protein [Chitinophagales bacterium]|nr:helix-turn-helix domain-containing protein [Bacteroidota bacterium]MCB9257559.1 helix-turn-helix domain-containing protein [Chitinophagales bacterium]
MSVYSKIDNYILQEFGARLKKERVRQGLSQEDLAALSGLTRVSISKMENGDNFNFLTLIKVLRSLNKLDEIEKILGENKTDDLLDLFK